MAEGGGGGDPHGIRTKELTAPARPRPGAVYAAYFRAVAPPRARQRHGDPSWVADPPITLLATAGAPGCRAVAHHDRLRRRVEPVGDAPAAHRANGGGDPMAEGHFEAAKTTNNSSAARRRRRSQLPSGAAG